MQLLLCWFRAEPPTPEALQTRIDTIDPDLFCHSSELAACLQAIRAGRSFVSAYYWAAKNETCGLMAIPGWADLSQQERRVVQLLAEGMTTAEIADKLFLSKHTVNNHRNRATVKLNLCGGGPGALVRFVLTNKRDIQKNT